MVRATTKYNAYVQHWLEDNSAKLPHKRRYARCRQPFFEWKTTPEGIIFSDRLDRMVKSAGMKQLRLLNKLFVAIPLWPKFPLPYVRLLQIDYVLKKPFMASLN